MKEIKVQQGCRRAPENFRIEIVDQGPYLVFGRPPLKQYFMLPNREGHIWYFKEGKSYSTSAEPTALCRCGHSKSKPYCDGAHEHAEWYGELTSPEEDLLDGADVYRGPHVALSDNDRYCVFARFCDAKGRVWNLAEEPSERAAEAATYEANHCPGGRLSTWDNASGEPNEPEYEPSLGLLEDPQRHCSSGLWVRGGIPVVRSDGYTYEIRNRVALCRCGNSSNKPFCDGTHASVYFKDSLPGEPQEDGKEF